MLDLGWQPLLVERREALLERQPGVGKESGNPVLGPDLALPENERQEIIPVAGAVNPFEGLNG